MSDRTIHLDAPIFTWLDILSRSAIHPRNVFHSVGPSGRFGNLGGRQAVGFRFATRPLLTVRTAVLNDSLAHSFRDWFPGFRQKWRNSWPRSCPRVFMVSRQKLTDCVRQSNSESRSLAETLWISAPPWPSGCSPLRRVFPAMTRSAVFVIFISLIGGCARRHTDELAQSVTAGNPANGAGGPATSERGPGSSETRHRRLSRGKAEGVVPAFPRCR